MTHNPAIPVSDYPQTERATHKKVIQGILGLLEANTIAYVPTQLVNKCTRLHGSPSTPTRKVADTTRENQWEILGRLAGIRMYRDPRGNATRRHDMTYLFSQVLGCGVGIPLVGLLERRPALKRVRILGRAASWGGWGWCAGLCTIVPVSLITMSWSPMPSPSISVMCCMYR